MNRKLLTSTAVLIALGYIGGLPRRANAQDARTAPAPAAGSRPTSVAPVIVTAPEQAPLTATFTESTISRETVENLSPSPTVTAQTILNMQPSVFAYTDGPFGVRTNIYLRAFNSSQFSETYDGVTLNDVFNGGVTNQAENANNVLVTTNNFDSVEVFRGINDPSVNSYNSLGGTINYLPRQPADRAGGEVGFSYGSFNTLQYHATANTGNIGGVRQLISLDQGSSDGWLKNTADRNTDLYYTAKFSQDNGSTLSTNFIYNRNTGHTPNNIPVPLLAQFGRDFQWPLDYEHHDIADTNTLFILAYKAQLTPGVSFENKAFFGYNDYERTSFSNPADRQSAAQPYSLDDAPSGFPFWVDSSGYPDGPTYDPRTVFGASRNGTDYHYYGYTATGFGYTPTLSVTLPFNELMAGGNITYAELHSREYWYGAAVMPHTQGYNDAWDEHDTRTFASLYIQDRIGLFDNKLHITIGGKFVYAATTDNDSVGFYYPLAGSVSDTEHYISPTIGLNFVVVDGLSVYGAFGQNIKFPDISAFYGAFQTNSSNVNTIAPVTVKPEYVNDYEGGIKYQKNGLSASLAAYREDFQNTFLTSTDPNSGLSLFHNGGSSQYQGVEVQLQAEFGRILSGNAHGYFNYAYNQAKFTTAFNSDYAGTVLAGQPLASVPDQEVSGGVVWEGSGWRANLDGRYVGRQFVDQYLAGLPSATKINPYYTVNIGVSKIIPVNLGGRTSQLRLAFNVDNLLDEKYFNEAYSDTDYTGASFLRAVAAAPRSFTGSLSFAF